MPIDYQTYCVLIFFSSSVYQTVIKICYSDCAIYHINIVSHITFCSYFISLFRA